MRWGYWQKFEAYDQVRDRGFLRSLHRLTRSVRRQSFWDSERVHLREALARLVADVKRHADDAASVGLRWSVV